MIIQILVYIISATVLADIWKKDKKIIVNKNLDMFLIIFGCLLCLSLTILLNIFLPMLNDIFINTNSFTNTDLVVFITISITSIILAPILEEIFYRYYLYEKIKSKTNIFLSVIITSIIFGIIHFYGITGLISSIFIGIILQVIYIYTNKLTNTIIIHAIYNLIIVILGLLTLPVNHISISIFVGIFLVSCITFLIILLKNLKTTKS